MGGRRNSRGAVLIRHLKQSFSLLIRACQAVFFHSTVKKISSGLSNSNRLRAIVIDAFMRLKYVWNKTNAQAVSPPIGSDAAGQSVGPRGSIAAVPVPAEKSHRRLLYENASEGRLSKKRIPGRDFLQKILWLSVTTNEGYAPRV